MPTTSSSFSLAIEFWRFERCKWNRLVSPQQVDSSTIKDKSLHSYEKEEKRTIRNLADSSASETEQTLLDDTGASTSPRSHVSRKKAKSMSERGVRDDRVQPGRLVCRWKLVSKPEKSQLTIDDLLYSRTPETHFKADVPGKYVLLLTVKGHGTTYTDQVTFIVKDLSQPDEAILLEESSDPNCIVLKMNFSDRTGQEVNDDTAVMENPKNVLEEQEQSLS
eukprot:jgi/Galph1/3312/GphlegSOOS_G2000.1